VKSIGRKPRQQEGKSLLIHFITREQFSSPLTSCQILGRKENVYKLSCGKCAARKRNLLNLTFDERRRQNRRGRGEWAPGGERTERERLKGNRTRNKAAFERSYEGGRGFPCIRTETKKSEDRGKFLHEKKMLERKGSLRKTFLSGRLNLGRKGRTTRHAIKNP